MKDETHKSVHTILRETMLGYTSESNRWPNDEEFKVSWMSKDAYRLMRGSLLLDALNMQMTSSKQENISIKSSLTIEHIMPQHWREEDWPLLAASHGESRESEAVKRYALIQTIGNLTLLTQPLNSSISNGSFVQKRPEIASQSQLRLNAYFQNPRDMNDWTEDDIITRGDALFKVACQIWPFS